MCVLMKKYFIWIIVSFLVLGNISAFYEFYDDMEDMTIPYQGYSLVDFGTGISLTTTTSQLNATTNIATYSNTGPWFPNGGVGSSNITSLDNTTSYYTTANIPASLYTISFRLNTYMKELENRFVINENFTMSFDINKGSSGGGQAINFGGIEGGPSSYVSITITGGTPSACGTWNIPSGWNKVTLYGSNFSDNFGNKLPQGCIDLLNQTTFNYISFLTGGVGSPSPLTSYIYLDNMNITGDLAPLYTSEPIAYYTFDVNANADIGFIDGTPSLPVTHEISLNCKKVGCYRFNGGSFEQLSFGSGSTVTTWTTKPFTHTILFKGADTGDNYLITQWGGATYPDRNFLFYINTNGYGYSSGNSVGVYSSEWNSSLSYDDWDMYTLTMDENGTTSIYVNENLLGTGISNMSALSSSGFVLSYSVSYPQPQPANGWMDEYRVYNRVLNQSEIIALYNLLFVETPKELIINNYSLDSINISWNQTQVYDKYLVYRNSINIANTTLINYSDINIIPDTLYCYNVTAYYNLTESKFSNTICHQTLKPYINITSTNIDVINYNTNNISWITEGNYNVSYIANTDCFTTPCTNNSVGYFQGVPLIYNGTNKYLYNSWDANTNYNFTIFAVYNESIFDSTTVRFTTSSAPVEPTGGGGGGATLDEEKEEAVNPNEELICNPGYQILNTESKEQLITDYDDVLVENYVREQASENTCGIDANQDGNKCDLNEDIFSCPEDCSLKFSEIICFDTERCIWTEEWTLRILLSIQLMLATYFAYVLWLK